MRFLGIEITSERALQATVPAPDDDFWYSSTPYRPMGGPVDAEKALTLTAVWNAVWLISFAVATFPFHLFRRDESGSRERDPDHPNRYRIFGKPNDVMTRRRWMLLHTHQALLGGNAYSYVERNGRNRIIEITPLCPDRMTVKVDPNTNRVTYHYREKTQERVYRRDEIFHLMALSPDGYTGYSPITAARIMMTLGLTMEQHAQLVWEQGTMIGGVLEYPGKLKEEARSNLQASWAKRYTGTANAGKVAVLEEGLKFSPLGMSNEDAQFLETRRFNTVQVAQLFNIPPHLLKDLERATFSNIEQQSQEYVTHTLGPWIAMWEDCVDDQLLDDGEEYFSKFSVEGLLRGDSAARGAFYHQGINDGWLSVNEARELEDRDPTDGGDKHFRPLNLTPLDKEPLPPAAKETPPPPPPAPAPAPAPQPAPAQQPVPTETASAIARLSQLKTDLVAPLADSLGRGFRREARALQKATRVANSEAFLAQFYTELQPTLVGLSLTLCYSYARLATRHVPELILLTIEQAEQRTEAACERWARAYVSSRTTFKIAGPDCADFVEFLEEKQGRLAASEILMRIDDALLSQGD